MSLVDGAAPCRIRLMTEGDSPAAANAPERPITVEREWAMIGIFAALCVAAEVLSYFYDPKEFLAGKSNLFSVATNLTWWLGHALWLSMDRRRRGLEGGRWRYWVIFFGPLAIWAYLVLEYRARAVYLIPLHLAIYGVMALVCLILLRFAMGAA